MANKPEWMKSLEEEWNDYAEEIFRRIPVSEVQVKETRKAFFSGALVAYLQMDKIGSAIDLPDEIGASFLEDRLEETKQFHEEQIRNSRE